MKNILILFIFLFSSNFAYSNGESSSSNYISERTLDDYMTCAAYYAVVASMAKATEKKQFFAYSSTQGEKALERALDQLSGGDRDETHALKLLESKFDLKLNAMKAELDPTTNHLTLQKDKYFKPCEEILNDSQMPIYEILKWADEGKCIVDNDGIVSAYLPFLAAMYNQKHVDNIKVKEHIISAVNRGCDVNQADHTGFSALNAGILFNEPDLVELMLNLGANPKLRIIRPGNSSGPNSFELLEFYNDSNKPRKEIEQILKQKHLIE